MIDNLLYAIKAGIEASEIVKRMYDNDFSQLDVRYKSDLSPVTAADRLSNEHIVRTLEPTRIKIISEESAILDYELRKNEQFLWMVDPLDGTKEFLNRSGEFTVNIALLEKNYPIMGVVCVPMTSMLYFAMKGLGSYMVKMDDLESVESVEQMVRQSVRLPVEDRSTRERYVIVASSSFRDPKTDAFINDQLIKRENSVVRQVGSSLKILLMAQGSIDLYPRFSSIFEWDIAAGVAIAEQAGVKIYNANSLGRLNFNTKELKTEDFVFEIE